MNLTYLKKQGDTLWKPRNRRKQFPPRFLWKIGKVVFKEGRKEGGRKEVRPPQCLEWSETTTKTSGRIQLKYARGDKCGFEVGGGLRGGEKQFSGGKGEGHDSNETGSTAKRGWYYLKQKG